MRGNFLNSGASVARWATRLVMVSLALCALIAASARAQTPETPPVAPRPDEVVTGPERPARPDASATRPVLYGDSPERIRALAQRAAVDPSAALNPPGPAHRDDDDDSDPVNDAPTKTPLFGDPPAARPSNPGASADSSQPSGDAPAASQPSNWMLDTLAALGIVVGVVLLTRWAMARVGGRVTVTTGRSPVEVLSRTAIAPRNHVVLLKIGQRIIVAGDSPAGLRALTEISDPQEVALILAETAVRESTSIRKGFGQLIARLNGDYDAAERVTQEGGDSSEHLIDRARDQLSALMSRVRAARIREEA